MKHATRSPRRLRSQARSLANAKASTPRRPTPSPLTPTPEERNLPDPPEHPGPEKASHSQRSESSVETEHASLHADSNGSGGSPICDASQCHRCPMFPGETHHICPAFLQALVSAIPVASIEKLFTVPGLSEAERASNAESQQQRPASQHSQPVSEGRARGRPTSQRGRHRQIASAPPRTIVTRALARARAEALARHVEAEQSEQRAPSPSLSVVSVQHDMPRSATPASSVAPAQQNAPHTPTPGSSVTPTQYDTPHIPAPGSSVAPAQRGTSPPSPDDTISILPRTPSSAQEQSDWSTFTAPRVPPNTQPYQDILGRLTTFIQQRNAQQAEINRRRPRGRWGATRSGSPYQWVTRRPQSPFGDELPGIRAAARDPALSSGQDHPSTEAVEDSAGDEASDVQELSPPQFWQRSLGADPSADTDDGFWLSDHPVRRQRRIRQTVRTESHIDSANRHRETAYGPSAGQVIPPPEAAMAMATSAGQQRTRLEEFNDRADSAERAQSPRYSPENSPEPVNRRLIFE